MPKDFPSHEYYHQVYDDYLNFLRPKNIIKKGSKTTDSALTSDNIILRPKGIQEIIEYYNEKYGVEIELIVGSQRKAFPKVLHTCINKMKAEIESKVKSESTELMRRGFIFFDSWPGRHGHAMPILWEKTAEKERIYFLDIGLFGYHWYKEYENSLKNPIEGFNSYWEPPSLQFKNDLRKEMPEIELWVSGGSGRQLDYSSCTIDALSVIKDTLRLKSSLSEIIAKRNKHIGDVFDTHFFYMPEELLKTVQIQSCITDSKSNLKETIHVHRVKDTSGKLTGEQKPVSLEAFREEYAVTTRDKQDKSFGSYTLHKGQRYAKIIEKHWRQKRQKELPALLAMLAKTKDDFDRAGSFGKSASATPGNLYLDVLRDDKNERVAVQQLEMMCDAITVVQNPSPDFKVSATHQKDAIAVTQLLLMLISDKTQPSIQKHFEQFIKGLHYDYINMHKFAKELLSKARSNEIGQLPLSPTTDKMGLFAKNSQSVKAITLEQSKVESDLTHEVSLAF